MKITKFVDLVSAENFIFIENALLVTLTFVFNNLSTLATGTDAAVSRYSSEQVFLKNSQYSQENTCVRVPF